MKAKFMQRVALLCGCGAGFMASQLNAAPVISELFYDAAGSDAGFVFVELFGEPGESLQGLMLEGINGSDAKVYSSISVSGEIPNDGVFVIGDDSGGSTFVANADLIADVDYQNGPDSVVLRDDVTVLDAVGYGSFGAGSVFSGKGGAAPDPAAGGSIARFNPFIDNKDNSVDFIVLDTPTPGVVPVVSAVPLPASLWLFASGLLPLLASRCRQACHAPVAGLLTLAHELRNMPAHEFEIQSGAHYRRTMARPEVVIPGCAGLASDSGPDTGNAVQLAGAAASGSLLSRSVCGQRCAGF